MYFPQEYVDSLDVNTYEEFADMIYRWLRGFIVRSNQSLEHSNSRVRAPLEERYGPATTDPPEEVERMNVIDPHDRPARPPPQPKKRARGFVVPTGDEDDEDERDEQYERRTDRVIVAAAKRRERAKFYIGAASSEERKRLFMETFEGAAKALVRLADDDPTTSELFQDPYRDESWYSSDQFNLSLQRSEWEERRIALQRQAFAQRYTVGNRMTIPSSVTNPTLFQTKWKSAHELFRSVLFGRDDLVLKLTPLFACDTSRPKNPRPLYNAHTGRLLYLADRELAEIYNEIRIAYFLNELAFRYSHVLSLHFMTIVDWFMTPSSVLAVPSSMPLTDAYYQVTVSERLDKSLEDYLDDPNTAPTLDALRVILFQILHALEIAWVTFRFLHHDLHPNNVMMKRVASGRSPLADRNFLYKRYNEPDSWYVLPRDALNNHYVKLMDFGRSRIEAPLSSDHVSEYSGKHVHTRLIGPYDFPDAGFSPTTAPTRTYDTRFLFGFLLMRGPSFWNKLERSAGTGQMDAIYDLIERAIDIATIEQQLRRIELRYATGDAYQARLVYDRLMTRRLTARQLRLAPPILTWLFRLDPSGSYFYTKREFGLTPTQALNSPFFAALRARFTEPEEEARVNQEQITTENVVVSLPGEFSELNPVVHAHLPGQRGDDQFFQPESWRATGTPTHDEVKRRCLCGAATQMCCDDAKTGAEMHFCGRVCYEFHYLFGGKTAFRT